MKKTDRDIFTEVERAADAVEKEAFRLNEAMHEADMSPGHKKSEAKVVAAKEKYEAASAKDDAALKAMRDRMGK